MQMITDLVIFAMGIAIGIALILIGIGMWDADKKIKKLERRVLKLGIMVRILKAEVRDELPPTGEYEDGSNDELFE